MKKWIKISIAAAVILFIGVSVIVNLNGYNKETYDESLKAFKIIDKAFQEERPLTEHEEMELERFLEMRDKAVDNFEDLKGKEENDLALLYFVGSMYDNYLVDMDTFKENFKSAQFLLEG